VDGAGVDVVDVFHAENEDFAGAELDAVFQFAGDAEEEGAGEFVHRDFWAVGDGGVEAF